MRGRKCNPNDIVVVARKTSTEVLGRTTGIHRDCKLRFKDHKRKISHDFPHNGVARNFLTWAQHGISDVLKYARHPSDVRGSHEDEAISKRPYYL
ncbi:hypothetical protein AVEN_149054-1 [Araneus ventricosus]|uniref:Uncharacterized protein n=1 Tax=Araneus ventricosus TaxID=182803 RepID=A0A4Y2LM19_ARAVE|nr:hypothetical protein AVEN_149054-1 [Araneus ventricosus]